VKLYRDDDDMDGLDMLPPPDPTDADARDAWENILIDDATGGPVIGPTPGREERAEAYLSTIRNAHGWPLGLGIGGRR
jgi:hypothetical protein